MSDARKLLGLLVRDVHVADDGVIQIEVASTRDADTTSLDEDRAAVAAAIRGVLASLATDTRD